MRSLWLCLAHAMFSAGLLLVLTAGARADLIVSNPTFDTPRPGASTTTLTGAHQGGYSAADHWSTFNNSAGTTTTTLVPGTLPSGGAHMIHVTTTGGGNGIVQVMAPHNTGPTSVMTSAYVYVLSGRVGLGTGNGGLTSFDAVSSTTNGWELLSAANGHAPANEVVLYSFQGPADFYVGQVSVDPAVQTASAPEPTALVSSAIGVFFSALGLGRWRKRGRETGVLLPSAE